MGAGDGQERQRDHRQGDVPVPGRILADLVAVLRQVDPCLAPHSQRLAVGQTLTCVNRNGSSRKAVQVASYFRRSGRYNGVLVVVQPDLALGLLECLLDPPPPARDPTSVASEVSAGAKQT
jgi:hypothetical protein